MMRSTLVKAQYVPQALLGCVLVYGMVLDSESLDYRHRRVRYLCHVLHEDESRQWKALFVDIEVHRKQRTDGSALSLHCNHPSASPSSTVPLFQPASDAEVDDRSKSDDLAISRYDQW